MDSSSVQSIVTGFPLVVLHDLVYDSFIICNNFHKNPTSMRLVYINTKFTKEETKFQDRLNNGPMTQS